MKVSIRTRVSLVLIGFAGVILMLAFAAALYGMAWGRDFATHYAKEISNTDKQVNSRTPNLPSGNSSVPKTAGFLKLHNAYSLCFAPFYDAFINHTLTSLKIITKYYHFRKFPIDNC